MRLKKKLGKGANQLITFARKREPAAHHLFPLIGEGTLRSSPSNKTDARGLSQDSAKNPVNASHVRTLSNKALHVPQGGRVGKSARDLSQNGDRQILLLVSIPAEGATPWSAPSLNRRSHLSHPNAQKQLQMLLQTNSLFVTTFVYLFFVDRKYRLANPRKGEATYGPAAPPWFEAAANPSSPPHPQARIPVLRRPPPAPSATRRCGYPNLMCRADSPTYAFPAPTPLTELPHMVDHGVELRPCPAATCELRVQNLVDAAEWIEVDHSVGQGLTSKNSYVKTDLLHFDGECDRQRVVGRTTGHEPRKELARDLLGVAFHEGDQHTIGLGASVKAVPPVKRLELLLDGR